MGLRAGLRAGHRIVSIPIVGGLIVYWPPYRRGHYLVENDGGYGLIEPANQRQDEEDVLMRCDPSSFLLLEEPWTFPPPGKLAPEHPAMRLLAKKGEKLGVFCVVDRNPLLPYEVCCCLYFI